MFGNQKRIEVRSRCDVVLISNALNGENEKANESLVSWLAEPLIVNRKEIILYMISIFNDWDKDILFMFSDSEVIRSPIYDIIGGFQFAIPACTIRNLAFYSISPAYLQVGTFDTLAMEEIGSHKRIEHGYGGVNLMLPESRYHYHELANPQHLPAFTSKTAACKKK